MDTPTAAAAATTGQELLLALMAVSRRLRSRTAGDRLDPASVFVLHHVCAKAPVRVSDLARYMGLDASTVSRHVSHLEEGGHLTRTSDPDDRRAARVQLTGKGRTLLDEAMRTRAAIVDRAIADWTDRDRHTLTALVTRLADGIDRLGPETETR
jgi:DNA-binding MarR family transcriptional regulator